MEDQTWGEYGRLGPPSPESAGWPATTPVAARRFGTAEVPAPVVATKMANFFTANKLPSLGPLIILLDQTFCRQ